LSVGRFFRTFHSGAIGSVKAIQRLFEKEINSFYKKSQLLGPGGLWGPNADAYVFMPFFLVSNNSFSPLIFFPHPDRQLTAG
jgi:hypothetical protein